LLALGAAPLTVLAGRIRTNWAAPTGAAFSALAFVATLWGWLQGGGRIDLAWAPSWDLRLTFALDGLALLYALLATGIGVLVIVYSSRYIPDHLAHQQRPASEQVRFFGFHLLFMGAMVGLVTAQDLVLMFVFWDITAIASYYLIGYDRAAAESRYSALMALLVTGVTSVLFLIGALLLYVEYGTFALPELIELVRPGPGLTVAGALIAAAALAKSAQVPFHFWLPRAMAAPTPVSAYLHSAAMVAAGVFLIGRFYPLLQQSEILLQALLAIGFLSMLIGGLLALASDVLKRILAYSTIAQYGYVVFMFGLGGEYGPVGVAFYVLAHALSKSALFLTAGAVTEATGAKQLSQLGGLRRNLPWLAVGSGAAAAGLVALPATIGFFKDELLFEAAYERGWPFAAMAVVGAAFTLAYIWRFWSGVFLGPPQRDAHPVAPALLLPVLVLGALVFVGGLFVGPFEALAEAAAQVMDPEAARVELAYHLDARPANLLALATYGLGLLLIVSQPIWRDAVAAFARLGERFGPDRLYQIGLQALNRLSRALVSIEVRDLRGRITTILVPLAILIGAGLAATSLQTSYVVGSVQISDLPLILGMLLAVLATLAVVRERNHLTLVLVLSLVGYSLAAAYAFFGAPDVALVMVLVETIFSLLLLGILVLFPANVLDRIAAYPTSRDRRWRDLLVGLLAGSVAFVVAWTTLSSPSASTSVAVEQTRLTPEAHAGDVVTAILADFRGLDTLGEISVVGIALLGIAALLEYRRSSR
jgi:multicomponent Na+:H+ antiporter subunit A